MSHEEGAGPFADPASSPSPLEMVRGQAAFLASRLRPTRAAAAAPNRNSMGGAGTGAGLPLLLPPGPQCPYLHPPGPDEVQPPLVDQPYELEP